MEAGPVTVEGGAEARHETRHPLKEGKSGRETRTVLKDECLSGEAWTLGIPPNARTCSYHVESAEGTKPEMVWTYRVRRPKGSDTTALALKRQRPSYPGQRRVGEKVLT